MRDFPSPPVLVTISPHFPLDKMCPKCGNNINQPSESNTLYTAMICIGISIGGGCGEMADGLIKA